MKVKIIIDVNNEEELKLIAKALANIDESSTPATKETEVLTCTPSKATPVTAEADYDREALEAEAKELDVPFRSNISDKSLEIKISNFKVANSSTEPQDTDIDLNTNLSEEEEAKGKEELHEKIKKAKEDKTKQDETVKEESEEEDEPDADTQTETEEPIEKEESNETDNDLKSALKSKRGDNSAIKEKSRKAKKIAWE